MQEKHFCWRNEINQYGFGRRGTFRRNHKLSTFQYSVFVLIFFYSALIVKCMEHDKTLVDAQRCAKSKPNSSFRGDFTL